MPTSVFLQELHLREFLKKIFTRQEGFPLLLCEESYDAVKVLHLIRFTKGIPKTKITLFNSTSVVFLQEALFKI